MIAPHAGNSAAALVPLNDLNLELIGYIKIHRVYYFIWLLYRCCLEPNVIPVER